jgi:hypothetical protein
VVIPSGAGDELYVEFMIGTTVPKPFQEVDQEALLRISDRSNVCCRDLQGVSKS